LVSCFKVMRSPSLISVVLLSVLSRYHEGSYFRQGRLKVPKDQIQTGDVPLG
jgi:hypothetical protein